MYNNASEIRLGINAQAESFRYFIDNYVLSPVGKLILQKFCEYNNVYVFSGLTRDFLTGQISDIRDLDFVSDGLQKSDQFFRLIRGYFRLNSFGGIKIRDENLNIDFWEIKNTWGIKELNLKPTPENLIKTTFFNCSAILFDYKEKRFIISDHFIEFLQNDILDYVYPVNPNTPLCIINTIYYIDKFNFGISQRLAKWIIKHYDSTVDYTEEQLRHFSRVMYSNHHIYKFINFINYVVQN